MLIHLLELLAIHIVSDVLVRLLFAAKLASSRRVANSINGLAVSPEHSADLPREPGFQYRPRRRGTWRPRQLSPSAYCRRRSGACLMVSAKPSSCCAMNVARIWYSRSTSLANTLKKYSCTEGTCAFLAACS